MLGIEYFNKKAMIYNRFSLKKIILDPKTADIIINNQNNLSFLKSFISKEIWDEIKPLFVEENDLKKKILNSKHFKFNIDNFYIIPTTNCNLNCEYCIINDKSKRLLDKKDLNKIMDIINDVRSNNSKVIIYGGEPLLNSEIVKLIIEKCNEIDSQMRIILISNGTLIDSELLQFFRRFNVNLSISLDGFKEQNDLARKFRDNSSSFDKILPILKNLKKVGFPYSISCTVGLHNYKKLKDICKFFVEDLNASSISFNLLRGKSNFKLDYNIATNAMIDAFKYLREKGIYEDRLIRKLRSFIEESFHIVDCSGCGHQITFNPNGSIGICHVDSMKDNTFTDIRDNNVIEKIRSSKIMEYWRNRAPINIKECNDCSYIGTCGGGCPLEARERYGSIYNIDDDFCDHTERMFKWMVEDLIRIIN